MFHPRLSFVWCAAALLLGGCQYTAMKSGDGCGEEKHMVMDGRFDGWTDHSDIQADEHYLYLRLRFDEPVNLQGSPRAQALWLDVDSDVNTGLLRPVVGRGEMGVDLEIVYSPKPDGRGVAMFGVDQRGRRSPINMAALDYMHAPTFASHEFELRLSRDLTGAPMLPRQGLGSRGRVMAVLVELDDAGEPTQWRNVLAADLHQTWPRRLTFGHIPHKHAGLRVMSHNVLHAAPMKNPEPFARLYRAVNPDIVLLQEWDDTPAEELVAWFGRHVPSRASWHAAVLPERGVAIVSRYPLSEIQRSVSETRWISARVETPEGQLLAASIHLTCCGKAGGPEDQKRIAEAAEINQQLAAVQRDLVVIGGDLNLVGARQPIDDLRHGLDSDRSDLSIVEPRVLQDDAIYTWRDAFQFFPPGRLDYLLYSDAAVKVTQTFIVDTGRFHVESSRVMDLLPDDSRASDHLPVVVDLEPIR